MLEKTKGHSGAWDVAFKASLTEDVLEEDPTSGSKDSIPTFHGYSASGNVTGQFVYVNYGTYADYEDLVHAGIDLVGKIAIAKYGGIFRGLKIKRAQELGMVGVLIYSDPGDDGERTEQNGYEVYPDGPARQPSSCGLPLGGRFSERRERTSAARAWSWGFMPPLSLAEELICKPARHSHCRALSRMCLVLDSPFPACRAVVPGELSEWLKEHDWKSC